jgi:hypothetical protein
MYLLCRFLFQRLVDVGFTPGLLIPGLCVSVGVQALLRGVGGGVAQG